MKNNGHNRKEIHRRRRIKIGSKIYRNRNANGLFARLTVKICFVDAPKYVGHQILSNRHVIFAAICDYFFDGNISVNDATGVYRHFFAADSISRRAVVTDRFLAGIVLVVTVLNVRKYIDDGLARNGKIAFSCINKVKITADKFTQKIDCSGAVS